MNGSPVDDLFNFPQTNPNIQTSSKTKNTPTSTINMKDEFPIIEMDPQLAHHFNMNGEESENIEVRHSNNLNNHQMTPVHPPVLASPSTNRNGMVPKEFRPMVATNDNPASELLLFINSLTKSWTLSLDPDYLSQKELFWLQQNRPELFQTQPHVHSNFPFFADRRANQRRKRSARSPRRSKHDDEEYRWINTKHPGNTRHSYKANKRISARKLRDDEEDETYRPVKKVKNKKRNTNKKYKSPDKKYGKLGSTRLASIEPSDSASTSPVSSVNRYTNLESKKVEKLDILGSGNFEIIRGGILDKQSETGVDKKDSKRVTKKIPKTKQPFLEEPTTPSPPVEFNNNNDSDEDDDGEDKPTARVKGKKLSKKEKESDDGSSAPAGGGNDDSNEPFDFDKMFGNDPTFQGFQGFDNFGADRNNSDMPNIDIWVTRIAFNKIFCNSSNDSRLVNVPKNTFVYNQLSLWMRATRCRRGLFGSTNARQELLPWSCANRNSVVSPAMSDLWCN